MHKISNLVMIIFLTTLTFSSGYKIPEQSYNSVALSGAYVSNANGPDSAYFNPANMVWQTQESQYEANMIYINLSDVEYDDYRTSVFDATSKKENFLLPTFHYLSEQKGKHRFGFSLAYPAGLSKRWKDPFPKAVAKEFTLEVIEANPTIAYEVTENIAVSVGLRGLFASGTVKSDAQNPPLTSISPLNSLSRELEGDCLELGYNIAISTKFFENWKFALTYRSGNDLNIEGSAELNAIVNGQTISSYDGDASVSVPVPAVFSAGLTYSYKNFSCEIVYEKTYWEEYEELDFDYDQSFGIGSPFYNFDNTIEKNWKTVKAYRIGFSYETENNSIFQLGYAQDSSPIPDDTLGFELPDSNSKIYSFGYQYQYSDTVHLGFAYLLSSKNNFSIVNDSLNGRFKNSKANIISLGLSVSI